MSGVGKTKTVKDTVRNLGLSYSYTNAVIESKNDFYKILYKENERGKKIIIFDDVDNLLKKNSPFRPMLISAMITHMDSPGAKRTITLKSKRDEDIATAQEIEDNGGQLPRGKYPQSFELKSKLIFITNLPEARLDPALQSRSMFLSIDFTKKQILQQIEKQLMNKHRKPFVKGIPIDDWKSMKLRCMNI
jgi:Cdc6-like AAA superfamily ATPase